jgi:RNA polymerase sigma factor (sigma-70 family)
MFDDAALLRRYARDRAEDAFAELVRRHLDGVYSAALRRVGGDTHLAEDVAQQVFTAAARDAERLSRHPHLSAWLYAATRNVAANVVRGERRRKAREQEAQAMHDILSGRTGDTTSPDAHADWSRVAPVLDAAIDQLGERDRAVVLLRFVERRGFAEIGATLRLSEDAARMRVERALDKLRALLVRRGIVSTATALGAALVNHAVLAAPAGLAATMSGAAVVATAASTTTTAAGAMNFLGIMSTTKLTVGIAGVVLAIALGVGLHEMQARRRAAAEDALDATNRSNVALMATMRDLEQRTRIAEEDVARLKREVDAVRSAQVAGAARAATPPPAAAKAPAPLSPVGEGKAFMARHPAVRQALDQWASAQVDARWIPFYASRGLTAAQIEQFQVLTRAVAYVPEEGADGKVLQLNAGPGLGKSEVDRRLRDLLGDDGFREYQQLDRARPAREFADQVASALAFTETPLSPPQLTRLAQIIDAHAADKPDAATRRFDWDAIVAQAHDVLSPSQLAVLDGMRAQDRFLQAWRRLPNPFGPPQPAAAAQPAK